MLKIALKLKCVFHHPIDCMKSMNILPIELTKLVASYIDGICFRDGKFIEIKQFAEDDIRKPVLQTLARRNGASADGNVNDTVKFIKCIVHTSVLRYWYIIYSTGHTVHMHCATGVKRYKCNLDGSWTRYQ